MVDKSQYFLPFHHGISSDTLQSLLWLRYWLVNWYNKTAEIRPRHLQQHYLHCMLFVAVQNLSLVACKKLTLGITVWRHKGWQRTTKLIYFPAVVQSRCYDQEIKSSAIMCNKYYIWILFHPNNGFLLKLLTLFSAGTPFPWIDIHPVGGTVIPVAFCADGMIGSFGII